MLSIFLLALLSITWSVSAVSSPARRAYNTHDYYVLEVDSDPEHHSNLLGVELVEKVGELDGFWLVRAEKREEEEDAILARYHASKPSPIKSLTYQTLRTRIKRAPPPVSSPVSSDVATRLGIVDPLFPEQWHLVNKDSPEHMMNVTGLWEEGYTGLGVISSLIDDGLDYTSEDLAENFDAAHSHDYNDHEDLPTPKLSDDTHGTRCAGQIAAAKNGVCGLGIAYHSRVAGVRILSGQITDTDEAAALNFGYDEVSIYSCSWGPRDDGRTMEGPDYLITKAMVNGVNRGRQGKGSVFVFASGNGKGSGDECNYDGYTNSIWSVTVGAVDWNGHSPYYSEGCAANMVVAYSSGSGKSIVTTDKGKNQCASTHGGTSAAAPNAVGVFALALQARPELTWRDIQHLCVRTARPINYDPRSTINASLSSRSPDTAYELTASKRPFSYAYGYGVLDAYTFVHAALTWDLVPPQVWMRSQTVVLGDGKMTKENVFSGGIPFGQEGQASVESTLEVTEKMLSQAHFDPHGLEHVNVKVWIDHQRRGDVHVEVVSPNGVRSVLAGVSNGDSSHEGDEGGRKNDKATTGFPGWVFMSVKHWEENPLGTWTIRVSDPLNTDNTGKFLGWNMVFWGSSTSTGTSAQNDPHKFELPPDDGNVFPPLEVADEPEWHETSTTTTVATSTSATSTTSTTTSLAPSTTRSYSKPTISSEIVEGTTALDAVETSATPSPTSTANPGLINLIASQKYFYAYIGLFFLIGLGAAIFFWLRRRRSNYEALAPREELVMRRIPGERGASEMYEAFDEGSDDEDEADVEQPMLRTRPTSQTRESRYRDELTELEAPANDREDSDGSWEHT